MEEYDWNNDDDDDYINEAKPMKNDWANTARVFVICVALCFIVWVCSK